MSDYKPGLYFVQERYAPQRLGRLRIWEYDDDWWTSLGDDQQLAHPDGEILSGPHTAEELLAALQRPPFIETNEPRYVG